MKNLEHVLMEKLKQKILVVSEKWDKIQKVLSHIIIIISALFFSISLQHIRRIQADHFGEVKRLELYCIRNPFLKILDILRHV